jgi:hypothetical protein
MIKRIKNMYLSINRNKRAANVNVISFDLNDPIYEKLLISTESRVLTSDYFENLNLTNNEIKVLLYIAHNGLGKGEVTKGDIIYDLDVDRGKLDKIMSKLKENTQLKQLLEDQLQTTFIF